MSPFIQFSLIVIFLFFSQSAYADSQTWLHQDFEDVNYFSPTQVTDGSNATNGSWEGLIQPHVEIHVSADARYHQSLRMRRIGSHRSFRFSGETPFPEGRNFVLGFDVYLTGHDKTYCALLDTAGKWIAGFSMIAERSLQVFDKEGVWGACGLDVPSGWSRVEAVFRVNEGDFLPRVILPDGSVQEGKPQMMLQSGTTAALSFGTVLPEDTSAILDNITITVESHRSITNRNNAARTATLTMDNFHSPQDAVAGQSQDTAVLAGNSGFLTFELQTLTSLNTIRISRSGTLTVRAIGINNGGQRQVLAEPENFTSVSGDADCFQADFKAATLRSVTLECRGQAGDFVRKIGLYESKAINPYDIDDAFREKVYGEFTLPVFSSQQNTATLHIFNSTDSRWPVQVSLRERYSGQDFGGNERILEPGKNVLSFPLSELPEGEFIAEISDRSVEAKGYRGSFRRLLRHQRTERPVRPESLEVTGQKIFFPDDHMLHLHQNLSFQTATADAWQVSRTHQVPGLLMQHGESLFQENGKLAVTFFCLDNFFRIESKRRFKATALLDNLQQWDYEELQPEESVMPGRNDLVETVSTTDWNPKPDANGNIQYKGYDPQRDGPVKLNQVLIKYVTFMPAGTLGGETLPDWGGLKPGARTTWPIWHKSPGEALILSQTPLFSDDRSAGEFEDARDTNDNFVGQWLSDDGKTLYYARGRVLRRYPPYNIPYDNLSNGVRILTVYKTTDGLNFSHSYMALPGEDDQPGSQHYGGSVIRLRKGNGLRVAFIARYLAGEQRIFLELAYSWDGFFWNRFPGNPPLLDNGPRGSWNAGYIGLGSCAIEVGDRVFYMITWSSSAYHVCAELLWDREQLSAVNGNLVKNYLEPRGIAAWPLLKQFQDYDDLAKYVRETTIDVGLASWRCDGLFYLTAGEAPGLLETCYFRADGGMTANLRLEPDQGSARFTLLDRQGQAIEGFDKTLEGVDDTQGVIFATLPKEEFRVKIEMKRGSLFSLGF